jgi:hypothetical protein
MPPQNDTISSALVDGGTSTFFIRAQVGIGQIFGMLISDPLDAQIPEPGVLRNQEGYRSVRVPSKP